MLLRTCLISDSSVGAACCPSALNVNKSAIRAARNVRATWLLMLSSFPSVRLCNQKLVILDNSWGTLSRMLALACVSRIFDAVNNRFHNNLVSPKGIEIQIEL